MDAALYYFKSVTSKILRWHPQNNLSRCRLNGWVYCFMRMWIQKSFGPIGLVRCVTLPAGFIPFLNSVNRPKVKCEGPSGFKSVVSCFYTVAFCKHNEIILVQQQIKCVILWLIENSKIIHVMWYMFVFKDIEFNEITNISFSSYIRTTNTNLEFSQRFFFLFIYFLSLKVLQSFFLTYLIYSVVLQFYGVSWFQL